jgi:hypothetical protein
MYKSLIFFVSLVFFFSFWNQGLAMLSRLAWNSLYSLDCPWTSNLASRVLGLQHANLVDENSEILRHLINIFQVCLTASKR